MKNESALSRFDHETVVMHRIFKWSARVLFTGGLVGVGVEAGLGNMDGVFAGVAAIVTSAAAYGASKAAEELLPSNLNHPTY